MISPLLKKLSRPWKDKNKNVIRKKQTAKYKKIFKEQGKDAYQKAIFDDMNTDRLKRGADVIVEKAQEALDAIEAEKLKQETESKWTLS